MQIDKGQWGAKTSIKWKIFGYLLVFVGFLLVLLWLLQVVFLDSIYKEIKTQQIFDGAKTISNNINYSELPSLLENISKQHGICIRVIDEKGRDLYSVGDIPECLIHKMDHRDVMNFYHQAMAEDGTVFRFFSIANEETVKEKTDRIRNEAEPGTQEKNGFRGNFPPFPRRAMMEQMVYAQVVNGENGYCMILLNATITPVQAVVETLRIELWWVSVILVVLSVLLAFFMARKVSAPIMKMNTAAKELARGSYDTVFTGDGYLEIQELNDTLNHTAKELAKVEGLRKELIANVSHDLRTPLTMIAGYGEVMRDIPGENTPENVQIIIDEARRLTDLVNDMLDLSKLQDGVHILQEETFNLSQCIREILSRYGKLTEQDGYQIIFDTLEDVWVNADKVKMEQVVYNLVNNAINYTSADKKIEICQTVNDGKVRIDILDDGAGIAPGQLPYIWERYYRTEHSHQRAVVGTGLGLSIVKTIFDLHDMAYGVENRPEGGCDFWFTMAILDRGEEDEDPRK